MATITINVNNEIEKTFRSKVYQIYGKRKGILGKALTEAMKDWAMRKEYFDSCIGLLSKGVDMGKLKYSKREELHDRN